MTELRKGTEDWWAWVLALLTAAYILYATLDWHVPTGNGVAFGPLWAVVTLGLATAVRIVRGRLTPTAALASCAVAGMVLSDATLFWSQGLRDFHLYLKAGEHFLAGTPVYLTGLITARPADLTNYPFLYPPLVLPAFAVLSVLPRVIVDVAWVAVSAGLAVAGLRAIGVPLRWAVAALLWPPFAQGLYVGNVSIPIFALFAFGPWLGSGLGLAAVFKLYDGMAALWLIRQRYWKSLAVGAGVVAIVTVATLPLTGIAIWSDWIHGLGWYARSQPLLPGSLYGIGLARYMPEWLGVGMGALLALAALRVAGLEGLARLGTATVVASPSLYAHGFLLAIPSMLRLRPILFWAAIGLTSVAPGPGWFLAIAITVAAWPIRGLRLTTADGAAAAGPLAGPADVPVASEVPVGATVPREVGDVGLHPLGSGRRPWPRAPREPVEETVGGSRVASEVTGIGAAPGAGRASEPSARAATAHPVMVEPRASATPRASAPRAASATPTASAPPMASSRDNGSSIAADSAGVSLHGPAIAGASSAVDPSTSVGRAEQSPSEAISSTSEAD